MAADEPIFDPGIGTEGRTVKLEHERIAASRPARIEDDVFVGVYSEVQVGEIFRGRRRDVRPEGATGRAEFQGVGRDIQDNLGEFSLRIGKRELSRLAAAMNRRR